MKLFFISCSIAIILVQHQVSSKKISFKGGEFTYVYNNDSGFLGGGFGGNVYKGTRTVGDESEAVACKEERYSSEQLDNEAIIYKIIGSHDSIPKFHYYFKSTDIEIKCVLVMELLGDSLEKLFKKFKKFSAATVMRIGLKLLDALDYVYSKGVAYLNMKPANFVVGLGENNSRIYLIDFGICKSSQSINGKPNVRRWDVNQLAHMLILLKQGKPASKTNDIVDKDCPGTLKLLLNVSDSAGIKNILETELLKHKEDPNYDIFEWQMPQNDKKVAA